MSARGGSVGFPEGFDFSKHAEEIRVRSRRRMLRELFPFFPDEIRMEIESYLSEVAPGSEHAMPLEISNVELLP